MNGEKARFVSELPPASSTAGRVPREPRYDELVANLGQWAEWWGDKHYVHKAARVVSRPGVRFEAAVRSGKGYIRAVSERKES